MKAKVAAIYLLAGISVLGIYTLNILFTEGTSFSRGSYKYWVTISSEAIRSFPVLGSVEGPVYYYSSRDGPSPATQEITYVSSIGEQELATKIGVFLEKQGFKRENNFFIREEDEIAVELKMQADGLIEVSALLSQH